MNYKMRELYELVAQIYVRYCLEEPIKIEEQRHLPPLTTMVGDIVSAYRCRDNN